MSSYRIQEKAAHRLDEICVYIRDALGEAQAETYIRGMFERFQLIADRVFPSSPIPAEFGVDGYFCRYEKHCIYWKVLANGDAGIVTILHERLHRIQRFREVLGD